MYDLMESWKSWWMIAVKVTGKRVVGRVGAYLTRGEGSRTKVGQLDRWYTAVLVEAHSVCG